MQYTAATARKPHLQHSLNGLKSSCCALLTRASQASANQRGERNDVGSDAALLRLLHELEGQIHLS